jgi:hypothetical protein
LGGGGDADRLDIEWMAVAIQHCISGQLEKGARRAASDICVA